MAASLPPPSPLSATLPPAAPPSDAPMRAQAMSAGWPVPPQPLPLTAGKPLGAMDLPPAGLNPSPPLPGVPPAPEKTGKPEGTPPWDDRPSQLWALALGFATKWLMDGFVGDGSLQSTRAKTVQLLDDLPGIRQLNGWLEAQAPRWRRWPTAQVLRVATPPETLERQRLQEHLKMLADWSRQILPKEVPAGTHPAVIQQFQKAMARHLDPRKLQSLDDLAPALAALRSDMKGQTPVPALVEKALRRWPDFIHEGLLRLQGAVGWPKTASLYHVPPETLGTATTLAEAADALTRQPKGPVLAGRLARRAARQGRQFPEGLTSAEKMVLGLERRLLNGLKPRFFSLYRQEYELLERLRLRPVGRFLVSASEILRRILAGETATQVYHTGAKPTGLLTRLGHALGPWAGPLVVGWFVFGPAVEKMREARKDDRLRGFMEGLLGAGLGNFIGWELGQSLLNKSGIVTTLLNGLRPGLALAPVIGLTVGGLVTDLISVLLVAGQVQNAGEWLAKKVFPLKPYDPIQELKTPYQPLRRTLNGLFPNSSEKGAAASNASDAAKPSQAAPKEIQPQLNYTSRELQELMRTAYTRRLGE